MIRITKNNDNEIAIKIGLAEENLKAILSALNNSVLVSITDSEGIITYANDMFVRISKYPREELIGSNHRILKSGFHQDSFYMGLWSTISHGHVWRGEIKNRAKDGSFYWVDSNISPIFDEFGKIQGYVAIRFLVTDKKELEEKLQKKNQELQSALEDFYSLRISMNAEIDKSEIDLENRQIRKALDELGSDDPRKKQESDRN